MTNSPATHEHPRAGRHAAAQLRSPLPRSLLCSGIMTRMVLAALAASLLWLTVRWALD